MCYWRGKFLLSNGRKTCLLNKLKLISSFYSSSHLLFVSFLVIATHWGLLFFSSFYVRFTSAFSLYLYGNRRSTLLSAAVVASSWSVWKLTDLGAFFPFLNWYWIKMGPWNVFCHVAKVISPCMSFDIFRRCCKSKWPIGCFPCFWRQEPEIAPAIWSWCNDSQCGWGYWFSYHCKWWCMEGN